MESLGIDSSDTETSLLQESISLKAFLQCSKDTRRDHLISTIDPNSSSIQTPEKFLTSSSSVTANISAVSSVFSQDPTSIPAQPITSSTKSQSHGKFSLSYDPRDNVLGSPQSPVAQSLDYFNEMSNDESKLPMNQSSMPPTSDMGYLTDRDRSKVAENFNAMNTIINSTFKEKIDYQRKLREQQSELNALKERMKRLRSENDYLAKTISKTKQSNLPITMTNIYKKRRLATLRRGLSRWQDYTRGSSLHYVKNAEREFERREAEYVHNGRLVVVKLRMSAFRSLGIIYARARREMFRKSFSHWHVIVSAEARLRQEKDKVTFNSVITLSKSRNKHRVFTAWRRRHSWVKTGRNLARILLTQNRKRALRGAMGAWRRGLKSDDQRKAVRACVRTLTRHSPLADCFGIWKNHYCTVYYPLRVRVVQAVWRRCCRMREQYLRKSFSLWSFQCKRDAAREYRLLSMVGNLRKHACRVALNNWNESISDKRRKHALLLNVCRGHARRNVLITKCTVFSRWRAYSIAVERQNYASALREHERHLRMVCEENSDKISTLVATHAGDTRTTLQCVKLVVKAMKLLSCRYQRRHRLMIAFRRWTYQHVMEKSCKSTEVVCYTHRIVMIMFARLKEKRMVAFAKWKTMHKQMNIKKKVILQLLNFRHKSNILVAFRKWKDFIHNHQVKALSVRLESFKVKTCISRWLHIRIAIPFRKWKDMSFFFRTRLKFLSRMKKIWSLYFMRINFQKWYRCTVFHDLLEQKSFLRKRQRLQYEQIERHLRSVDRKCQARMMLRWKQFKKHSRTITEASHSLTKMTQKQLYKVFFSGWEKVYRLRQKFIGGLRIIHSLSSCANTVRVVKYFNHWTRAVATQVQLEQTEALSLLKHKHMDCVEALHVSQSLCGETEDSVSRLTHINHSHQLAQQRNEEYKNAVVDHLVYKKQVQAVFNQWRQRFILFKSNTKMMFTICRRLFRQLDSYCIRQKFSSWKCRTIHLQACSRALILLENKWTRIQVQNAFRMWQLHSVHNFVASVTDTVRVKHVEMEDEIILHENEKSQLNSLIVCMNNWRHYLGYCLKRKKKLRGSVLIIAQRKIMTAFHKWKHTHWCITMLTVTTQKLTKAKLFSGFTHWKRTHSKILKLDGVIRHLQKWQRRSVFSLFRTWLAYHRDLQIQRLVLRSVLLAGGKRAQLRAQVAFNCWKDLCKSVRTLEHKERYVSNRRSVIELRALFSNWYAQCAVRKGHRSCREKVVFSVSQTLPLVKDLYDVLFSAETVDESVALSTIALEKILPSYTAEIYVMVSNSMLRASVPLQSSVQGTTSRFGVNGTARDRDMDGASRERETKPSPMNIPSSPIYPHTNTVGSPPPGTPSFSQNHLLPSSSSGQTPWTVEKPMTSGGNNYKEGTQLFQTPHEQRYPVHESSEARAEIVSVIVGRGNVGLCAKTGTYQVHRQVTSNSLSPDKKRINQSFSSLATSDSIPNNADETDDIVSIVVPLISSGCIVGVLQLTPRAGRGGIDLSAQSSPNPDSPVSFPYPPATSSGTSFSYPFSSHQPSFSGSYSMPMSSGHHQSHMQVATNPTLNMSRFLKSAVAPLPHPQFTELVNMCMDVKISDIGTITQLCIVVGTLADTVRKSIEGSVQKADYMAIALAEKDQLESYISQLHGEVATFEESIEKSAKRIDHLEKSRLKYFNECKALKEKAEGHEKNFEGLTETLNVYRQKLDKYEDKKRSEGVVLDKLHQSLTQATIEVFGTPASSSNITTTTDIGPGNYSTTSGVDGGIGGYRSGSHGPGGRDGRKVDGDSGGYEHIDSSYHLPNSSSRDTFLRKNLEDSTHLTTSGDEQIRINTSMSAPNILHGSLPPPTNTTYDTSSLFSPNISGAGTGRSHQQPYH